MKILLYSYSEEDHDIYEMIKAWSPDTFPQPALLPKMGVIVTDDDGEPLVYLCADMSNSVPRAFIDHLQTNPEASIHRRYKATKLADEFLCERLKDHGYLTVYSISRVSQVSSLSHSLGYETYGEKLNFFQKLI